MITLKKMKYLYVMVGLLISASLFLVSCRKNQENDFVHTGQAKVKINLLGSSFETQSLGNALHASTVRKTKTSPIVQDTTLQLAPDIWVNMQLTNEDAVRSNAALKASVAQKKAVVEELPENRQYRVLVYDDEGSYVTHTDFRYRRGQAPTEELLVEGGQTYTFVAYMVKDNPEAGGDVVGVPLDEAKIHLSVWNEPYQDEFAWWKETLFVQGGETTNLNITLNYISSSFTVVHDASAIADKITAINACGLYDMYTEADVSLADGQTHYGELNENASVNGNQPTNYPASIVQFGSRDIFTNIAYYRAEVFLESVSRPLYLRTNSFNIEPGTRYKLTMKYMSKQNNVIWSPGNVVYIASQGKYTFAGQTAEGSYFAYNSLDAYNPTTYTWHKKESTLVGRGDPCERVAAYGGGWRLPTEDEWRSLYTSGIAPYSGGGFRQFRNANTVNIRGEYTKGIYLPLGGDITPAWANVDSGRLLNIGTRGSYWGIDASNQPTRINVYSNIDTFSSWKTRTELFFSFSGNEAYRGFNVRCVRDAN